MKNLLSIVVSVVALTVNASPVRSAIGAKSMVIDDVKDEIIPVEYIESTGTQWINTGICINSETDVITCRFTPLIGNNNWEPYFGVQENIKGTARFFEFQKINASSSIRVIDIDYRTVLNVDNLPHDIILSGALIAVDGKELSPSYYISRAYSIPYYLFARNNAGTPAYPSVCRIEDFSVYRNGTPILGLMAVKFLNEDKEWEGAMYDIVSGELLRNSGTGRFIIGPDKQ